LISKDHASHLHSQALSLKTARPNLLRVFRQIPTKRDNGKIWALRHRNGADLVRRIETSVYNFASRVRWCHNARSNAERDRLIYRYRPKRPIISTSIGIDKTLLYQGLLENTVHLGGPGYIPHASGQLAQESTTKQVKTVTLQQRWQVRFHKQADKMNHGARIDRRRRNKSIIINQINQKS